MTMSKLNRGLYTGSKQICLQVVPNTPVKQYTNITALIQASAEPTAI